MKLPNQSPPVQRTWQPSSARQPAGSQTNNMQASAVAPSGQVGAADYGECYNLRGLAQQLCLANY
jgi:hypothetical protein